MEHKFNKNVCVNCSQDLWSESLDKVCEGPSVRAEAKLNVGFSEILISAKKLVLTNEVTLIVKEGKSELINEQNISVEEIDQFIDTLKKLRVQLFNREYP